MNTSNYDELAETFWQSAPDPSQVHVDYRNVVRPRAGSWLDKTARRMNQILEDEYQLVGFDPEMSYLVMVEDVRRWRASLAATMHVTPASAQRWITDDSIKNRAGEVAKRLADEKPGSAPFADRDTIAMPVDEWARALWSLQIVAVATKPFSEPYAWSMVSLAAEMAGAMARSNIDARTLTFMAPRAGVAYVARALDAAAAMVTDWQCPVDGLETWQLIDGLSQDAALLREALIAS